MKEVLNESSLKIKRYFGSNGNLVTFEWNGKVDLTCFFMKLGCLKFLTGYVKTFKQAKFSFLVDFWLIFVIGYICLLLLDNFGCFLVGWRRPYVWGTVGRLFAISQQPSSHSCTQSVSDSQKGKTPSWMIFFQTFTFILKFSLSLSF